MRLKILKFLNFSFIFMKHNYIDYTYRETFVMHVIKTLYV